MDQPVFRKNANGEIEEYKPVKADRAVLQKDLETAEKRAKECAANVQHLEAERDKLTEQLGKVNDALTPAYDAEEAANEDVAFRRTRLAAFDQAAANGPDAPVRASVPDVEALDEAGPDDDDPEPGVAEGDEPEADPDEQAEPSEEVSVPIRRRASA